MPLGGERFLRWRTRIDNTQLQKDADKTVGVVSFLGKRVRNIGAFRGVGAALSLAAGIASKSLIGFAREFNEAMLEVATISRLAQQDFQGVKDEILEISRVGPQTAQNLARGFYQVVSAGDNTRRAFDTLAVSAKLATAGITDTFTSADVLTSVLNAYTDANRTAIYFADRLFTIVRLGKTTFTELAGVLPRVTKLANAAGLSFNELSAIIAETVKTLPTDQAITGLRTFFNAIIAPTPAAQKVARELGLEFTATALAAKGLIPFMRELFVATKDNIEAQRALFPEMRAMTVVLAASGEDGAALARTFREIENSSGAVAEAAEIMQRSLTNQFAILKNNVLADIEPISESIRQLVVDLITFGIEAEKALSGIEIDNIFDRIEISPIGQITIRQDAVDVLEEGNRAQEEFIVDNKIIEKDLSNRLSLLEGIVDEMTIINSAESRTAEQSKRRTVLIQVLRDLYGETLSMVENLEIAELEIDKLLKDRAAIRLQEIDSQREILLANQSIFDLREDREAKVIDRQKAILEGTQLELSELARFSTVFSAASEEFVMEAARGIGKEFLFQLFSVPISELDTKTFKDNLEEALPDLSEGFNLLPDFQQADIINKFVEDQTAAFRELGVASNDLIPILKRIAELESSGLDATLERENLYELAIRHSSRIRTETRAIGISEEARLRTSRDFGESLRRLARETRDQESIQSGLPTDQEIEDTQRFLRESGMTTEQILYNFRKALVAKESEDFAKLKLIDSELVNKIDEVRIARITIANMRYEGEKLEEALKNIDIQHAYELRTRSRAAIAENKDRERYAKQAFTIGATLEDRLTKIREEEAKTINNIEEGLSEEARIKREENIRQEFLKRAELLQLSIRLRGVESIEEIRAIASEVGIITIEAAEVVDKAIDEIEDESQKSQRESAKRLLLGLSSDLSNVSREVLKREIQIINNQLIGLSRLDAGWQSLYNSREQRVNQLIMLEEEAGDRIRDGIQLLGDTSGGTFDDITDSIEEARESAREITDVVASISVSLATGGTVGTFGAISGIVSGIGSAVSAISSIFGRFSGDTEEVIKGLSGLEQSFESRVLALGLTSGNQRIRVLSGIVSDLRIQIERLERNIGATIEASDENIESLDNLRERYSGLSDELAQLTTASSAEGIADSIISGFEQGFNESGRLVENFAGTLEDLFRNALINSFRNRILQEFVIGFQTSFIAAFSDQEISEEERLALTEQFNKGLMGAATALEEYEKIADEAGFDLFESQRREGLRGEIRGITEQTAGILEGQFRGMREDIRMLRISLTEESPQAEIVMILKRSIDPKLSEARNSVAALPGILTHQRDSIEPVLKESRDYLYEISILTRNDIAGTLKESIDPKLSQIRDYVYHLPDILTHQRDSIEPILKDSRASLSGIHQAIITAFGRNAFLSNAILSIETNTFQTADNTDRLENIEKYLKEIRDSRGVSVPGNTEASQERARGGFFIPR